MEEPRVAPAGEEGRRLPSLKPGEVFASRYRVEKQLGQGLYGEVYQVKHIKYGQNLVLKLFYPGTVPTEEARQAFKAEFDRVKQLKHPGNARYFEQGDLVEANTKYATMEFVNGSSLRQLMTELHKQGKKFGAQDSVQIIIKLLETLKTVHAAGLSHRNIKPENVLIVAKGKAADKVQWDLRLSDFALTKAPVDWLTEVSSEKLPYMAPELRGYGGQVGAKADIYAVGALLYEMLTGMAPDTGYVPPTQRRPSLPKKFDDIIELTLAEMPSDRYSSVQDLLFELEQLPAVLPYEEEREPRSKLAPILVVAGLALLAGVIGFILTRQPTNPAPASGPGRWALVRDAIKKAPDLVTETPEAIAAKTGKEPGMVYIPGGSYLAGAFNDDPLKAPSETKEHKVTMPGYYIDQYEFPNVKGQPPATRLSWDEAEKACNKKGKRLCTEIEWERACKGAEFSIYSYGDTYDAAKCPPAGSTLPTLGSAPDCKSSYDVFDMSGGVPEWINGQPAAVSDRRFVKGGQIGGDQAPGTRCSAIGNESMNLADPNIGFRCCK